jgi:ABC-2 type transport system ATP-binding protein
VIKQPQAHSSLVAVFYFLSQHASREESYGWHCFFKVETLGLSPEAIMSEAVVVNNAYKMFGSPGLLLWKQIPLLHGRMNSAGAKGRSELVIAVDHVSFSVWEGEIFGILGPSGSGKSTLVRLLATQLLPDAGDIHIFGYDVVRQQVQVQRLVNRISVDASFFKKLSPVENLLYGARLYGLSGYSIRRQAVELLTRLGLEERSLYEPMENMSRCMQQKVAIARAILSRPRLLLLDEPTRDLESRSKNEVEEVIRELRDQQGTTILFTTRDMSEIERLCDRIAVIDGGKIVAIDTPAGLRQSVLQ